jgi:hypothetical protein
MTDTADYRFQKGRFGRRSHRMFDRSMAKSATTTNLATRLAIKANSIALLGTFLQTVGTNESGFTGAIDNCPRVRGSDQPFGDSAPMKPTKITRRWSVRLAATVNHPSFCVAVPG